MDVKKLVDERMAADPRLRSCMKRINSGKGTFADTAYYSSVSSEILGKVFGDNVLKISEADREAICMELLKGSYDRINQICQQVQLDLDREAGIHIRPQQAPFPEERAAQLAHSLVDKTVAEEVIKRRAANGSENISKSFHDDYIEQNAKFRSDAGLKCYITRTGSGTSCPWCSEVSGKFTFDDAPAGVFRRHDKCNCEIIYENGRTRQNLKGAVNEEGQRTKKWEVAEEVNVEPPKKFSSDEQPKGFKPKVLTDDRKGGKIETNGKYTTAGLMFISHRDDLYRFAEKVPPLKSHEDIVFHADRDSFLVLDPENQDIVSKLSPKDVADLIRNSNNYEDGAIRLLSCQAGYGGNESLAKQLADELGVEVMAPTEILAIDNTGKMFISDNQLLIDMWEAGEKVKETGKWEVFKPDKQRR